MKNVFYDVSIFDQKCYKQFFLTEDILMEHAANAISEFIRNKFNKQKSILIVCGSGNNGADGIALARILHGDFDVKLFLVKNPKTQIGEIQLQRAKSLGINVLTELEECDVVVDCILGSGQSGIITPEIHSLISNLNALAGFKIACDIPTGIGFGNVPFIASATITMGALKTVLFEDFSKDVVGEIIIANLGISDNFYQENSHIKLLEISDLRLPIRNKLSSHKGNFGHMCVIAGDKKGAAVLCATAGINFGAGLVTIVSHESFEMSPVLMNSHVIPDNTTSICLGMGLGSDYEESEIDTILKFSCSKIIDADFFYNSKILTILNEEIVLTPHPKEFASLLKICGLENVNHDEIASNRFYYVEVFTKKFPKAVLVLKGANTLIAHDNQIWINPFGSQSLSKGGSGDVLSGIIGALLAQKFSPIEAAINGSMALSLASMKYDKNNYSMTPLDLINLIKEL